MLGAVAPPSQETLHLPLAILEVNGRLPAAVEEGGRANTTHCSHHNSDPILRGKVITHLGSTVLETTRQLQRISSNDQKSV